MLSLGEAIQKKRSGHTYRSVIRYLNWNKLKPPRAGVIPYLHTKDGLVFAFGLDTIFRELTDFGGGVRYKREDKSAVIGALREFQEESLGVFGEFTPKSVENCFTIYNSDLLIIFLKVEDDPKEKNVLFHEKLKEENDPEVCDIVWLSEGELKTALESKSRLIYVLVRDLIVGAGDFYAFLSE